VERMQLAQDKNQWWAHVNTVMNVRVPQKAGNFLTSWMNMSLLIRTQIHRVI